METQFRDIGRWKQFRIWLDGIDVIGWYFASTNPEICSKLGNATAFIGFLVLSNPGRGGAEAPALHIYVLGPIQRTAGWVTSIRNTCKPAYHHSTDLINRGVRCLATSSFPPLRRVTSIKRPGVTLPIHTANGNNTTRGLCRYHWSVSLVRIHRIRYLGS